MSWGIELWDQFDEISSHTQKGLEFCERYSHFIKERCAIEKEYSTKLNALVKKYQPKKKEEEDYEFTCAKGFLSSIKEVIDIAGQHEMIAENLNTSIIKETTSLLQELKHERKKYLQEGREQAEALKSQLEKLDRSKRQYEKAFKDSEKAQENYRKADADINLSRAEVEKAKNISITKQQHCESCKNEYAAELQKANNAQQEHYQTLWPRIFQNLQDMDERRVARIQEFIRQSANIERNVIPIINACIDGMLKAADSIQPSQDSQSVIDRYKSGFQPPGDIPFEDLSNTGYENHNHANTPRNTLMPRDTKGTVSGGKPKKRTGLFGIFSSSKANASEKSLRGAFNGLVHRTDDTREDYSHLPPNQQKKKLNQKIDGLRTVIAKETAERDGMLKMRDVYVQNPALGDPSSLDKQLEENAQKLDKLRQEQQKYEGYLTEADKRSNCQKNAYGSDESLTRSASDASVSLPQQQRGSLPGTPNQTPLPHSNPPRESPDSGVDSSQRGGSFAEQDSFDDGLDDDLVIGTCRAMYPFEAQNDGSVPMTEGEELQILEQDQGDGWTRVRNNAGDEGFVPTSYIDCHLYDQQ